VCASGRSGTSTFKAQVGYKHGGGFAYGVRAGDPRIRGEPYMNNEGRGLARQWRQWRQGTAAGETAMRVRVHAISHPVCTLMSPWRLLVQSGSPAGRPGRKGALLLHAVVAQGQLARATSPWCAAACDTMSVGGRGWTRRSGETHAHMRCRKHAVCDGFAQDTTHTYTRWKKNTQRFSGTAHNLCLFLSCSLNKLS
jgi:hypothetical protein